MPQGTGFLQRIRTSKWHAIVHGAITGEQTIRENQPVSDESKSRAGEVETTFLVESPAQFGAALSDLGDPGSVNVAELICPESAERRELHCGSGDRH